MQHVRSMGPILFMHNENIAHIMPCVTACSVTSYAHHMRMHAGNLATLIIHGMPGTTYGHAICAG